MRTLLVSALLIATANAAPSAWTKIWESSTERIGDHWAIASLDSRNAGKELEVSIGVAVGSIHELATKDVAIELHAGTRTLACKLEPMSYTETLAITAQASASCKNPGKATPTEVVVTVKGVAHAFAIKAP